MENSKLPTPINTDRLADRLKVCDPIDRIILLKGFKQGFNIGFKSLPNCSLKITNLRSAEENPLIMNSLIQKEIDLGRIKGPFDHPPFPKFQISPVGLVPKREANSFRMITHLSCPDGQSINDGIPDLFAKVAYASVQDAIELIIKVGKDAFLAKTDIKSAFRIIPLAPDQYHLLCFKWENNYFYDCCLPMGVRSACQIFEMFSTSLECILHNEGVEFVVHYLDDFLIINNSYDSCLKDLHCFENLAIEINLPLAPQKTVLPTQTIQFLGIEIDTTLEIIRLPQDKLIKCREMINTLLGKSKCQLRELQCLLGLLNFACMVIIPGRAFLQSLYPLVGGLKKKHHFKRLTKQTKADLNMFLTFLKHYNGVSFYRQQQFLSPNVKNLYTDAAKSLGYGAWLDKSWFSEAWPSEWWLDQNITFLELVPIVIALTVWGNDLENSVLNVHTDNEALYFVINKQYSKEPLVKMWIRKLVLLTLTHNICMKAFHIAGENNVRADHLSRLEVNHFKINHISANIYPTVTPLLQNSLQLDM